MLQPLRLAVAALERAHRMRKQLMSIRMAMLMLMLMPMGMRKQLVRLVHMRTAQAIVGMEAMQALWTV